MTQKPKIALIISSTRKARFADKPAEWLLCQNEGSKRDYVGSALPPTRFIPTRRYALRGYPCRGNLGRLEAQFSGCCLILCARCY